MTKRTIPVLLMVGVLSWVYMAPDAFAKTTSSAKGSSPKSFKKVLLMDTPAQAVDAKPAAAKQAVTAAQNDALWGDEAALTAQPAALPDMGATATAQESVKPSKKGNKNASKGTKKPTKGAQKAAKTTPGQTAQTLAATSGTIEWDTAAVAVVAANELDPFASADAANQSAFDPAGMNAAYSAVYVSPAASSPQPNTQAAVVRNDAPLAVADNGLVVYSGASEEMLLKQAAANKQARLEKEAAERAAAQAAQADSVLNVLGGAVLGMALDQSLDSVVGNKLSDSVKQGVVEKTVTAVSGSEKSAKTYKQMKGVIK